MKIPFDYIIDRAFQLLNLSVLVDSCFDVVDEFYNYIEACGWTESEFDAELLKRINSNWEPEIN